MPMMIDPWGTPSGPCCRQVLALLTQPTSGGHLLEHRASMTALRT